jgi:hypothetical protein
MFTITLKWVVFAWIATQIVGRNMEPAAFSVMDLLKDSRAVLKTPIFLQGILFSSFHVLATFSFNPKVTSIYSPINCRTGKYLHLGPRIPAEVIFPFARSSDSQGIEGGFGVVEFADTSRDSRVVGRHQGNDLPLSEVLELELNNHREIMSEIQIQSVRPGDQHLDKLLLSIKSSNTKLFFTRRTLHWL